MQISLLIIVIIVDSLQILAQLHDLIMLRRKYIGMADIPANTHQRMVKIVQEIHQPLGAVHIESAVIIRNAHIFHQHLYTGSSEGLRVSRVSKAGE